MSRRQRQALSAVYSALWLLVHPGLPFVGLHMARHWTSCWEGLGLPCEHHQVPRSSVAPSQSRGAPCSSRAGTLGVPIGGSRHVCRAPA
jgi:hypothetical protein